MPSRHESYRQHRRNSSEQNLSQNLVLIPAMGQGIRFGASLSYHLLWFGILVLVQYLPANFQQVEIDPFLSFMLNVGY